MEQKILTVIKNRALGADIYELTLSGEDLKMLPGQFVELKLDGFFLRRPISVCDSDYDRLTLLYKVAGEGTKAMTFLSEGDRLDALTHLGNGFRLSAKRPLLIGGGIGIAPLYRLAKEFKSKGVDPEMILGFKNADEAVYTDKFSAFGKVIIATDDGSMGVKGNAVSAMKASCASFDRYYACGPSVMLKALKEENENGELSLEARMGCGFGVCMGCSVMTKSGAKRVCREGPVFDASEVLL